LTDSFEKSLIIKSKKILKKYLYSKIFTKEDAVSKAPSFLSPRKRGTQESPEKKALINSRLRVKPAMTAH
jgi:hypothetical protein